METMTSRFEKAIIMAFDARKSGDEKNFTFVWTSAKQFGI